MTFPNLAWPRSYQQETKPKSAYIIWSEDERIRINRQHHFYRSENGLQSPALSNDEVSVELGRYA